MGGASITPDVGERAVRAFSAGNDMLMFAGTVAHQRRAFQAVLRAVETGRISKTRLNESVARILEAKQQLRIASSKIDARKARAAVRKLEGLSREVMHKNFQLAIEGKKSWPTVDQDTRVEVFTSSAGFYRSFKNAFPGRTRLYGLSPRSLSGLSTELERPGVTFGVYYASGTTTAHFLRRLNPQLRAKLIVVNCNHAGAVDNQDSFLSVLNLNSHSPESGEWLAQTLAHPPQESPLIPETPPLDMRTPAGELEGE
jgi:beta-N-acetylhexosaminidase